MPPTAAPTPLETLRQPRAIISTMIAGQGLALVLALGPGMVPGMDQLVFFGLASLMIQWIALATLGVMYVLRRPLASLPPGGLAWTALGLILLSTWVVGALVWVLSRDTWLLASQSPAWFFFQLTGVALTVGLLALVAFQLHWRSKLLAVEAEHAQLASLQARTHPHFLFNTLNTGIALARTQPEATERLLLDLSDLFRAALEGPRMVGLEEELELTRRYLEIEALRFGNRLDVRWELPTPLPDAKVPRLSLQPLAENAVRHGIERMVSGGRIDIMVTSDSNWVHITIRNDLPPPTARPSSNGHNIGLASVRERIETMTGGLGGLTAHSHDDCYTASLRLPLSGSQGET